MSEINSDEFAPVDEVIAEMEAELKATEEIISRYSKIPDGDYWVKRAARRRTILRALTKPSAPVVGAWAVFDKDGKIDLSAIYLKEHTCRIAAMTDSFYRGLGFTVRPITIAPE